MNESKIDEFGFYDASLGHLVTGDVGSVEYTPADQDELDAIEAALEEDGIWTKQEGNIILTIEAP